MFHAICYIHGADNFCFSAILSKVNDDDGDDDFVLG